MIGTPVRQLTHPGYSTDRDYTRPALPASQRGEPEAGVLVPLPHRCNCRWLVVDVLSIAARSFTAARMKRTISRPGDQLQILSVSALTLSSVTRIRLQHSWPRAASARGQRPYATNQITPADMISRRGVWQTLGPLVQPSSKLGNRLSAISSSNPLGRVTEARKARSWCAFVNSDVECTTVSTVNILSRHGSVAKAPGWPASCSHAVDYRGAHVELDQYGQFWIMFPHRPCLVLPRWINAVRMWILIITGNPGSCSPGHASYDICVPTRRDGVSRVAPICHTTI